MKKMSSLCLCLLILITSQLLAQDTKLKWGKVEDEDLQLTTCSFDTEAEAMVLGETGKIEIEYRENRGFFFDFEHHRRIKILKEPGLEQGDVTLHYYHGNNLEKMGSLKAQVIQPDGSSEKLKNRDFFEEELNDNWTSVTFTLPQLQVGSIIEYSYSIESERIINLKEWFFQHEIPVRFSELMLVYPTWFDYQFITQGESRIQKEDLGVINSSFGTGISIDMNRIQFLGTELPGLRAERYISTMEDYMARIRFQLNTISFPGQGTENYLSTWYKLANDLWNDYNFGKHLDHKGRFNKLLEAAQQVVPPEGSASQIAAGLYAFINSQMGTTDMRTYYPSDKIDNLFEQKSAARGELNFMLIALLRAYGLDSYPVLISTRENGRPLLRYPIRDQFDHTLAAVSVDGQLLLLDAGNPFRPPGLLATNSLNYYGWLMRPGAPEWIQLPVPKSTESFFYVLSVEESGTTTGNIAYSADGYDAARMRAQHHQNEQFWNQHITQSFKEAEVSQVSVENDTRVMDKLKVKSAIALSEPALVSGDRMYLSLPILSVFKTTPFKLEKRSFPVDIGYTFAEQHIFNLQLPEGYQLEEVPEQLRNALPEDAAVFEYRVSQNPTGLQVIVKLEINKALFSADEYPALRQFFSLVEQKLGEQLVLKKG